MAESPISVLCLILTEGDDDGDGIPDHLDNDDDNDGIPDDQDNDDDGDGIPDADEGRDKECCSYDEHQTVRELYNVIFIGVML